MSVERWWVLPSGEAIKVADHVEAALSSPHLFKLSADDVHYTRFGDPERPTTLARRHLAVCDKLWAQGYIQIETGGTARNFIAFWGETEDVYRRLMRWAASCGLPVETEFVMSNTATGQRWHQTLGAISKGFQFSADPSRGGRCPKCGAQMSWDEVLHKGRCPSCGEAV